MLVLRVTKTGAARLIRHEVPHRPRRRCRRRRPASGARPASPRRREDRHGHERLPRQRAGAGRHRTRRDLLLALPPRGRRPTPPGTDDHAQPRLGRLTDHRPGVVPEVAGRGLRRALVRPARLRRERRTGPRREPGIRRPRRTAPDRADRGPALGPAGREGRPPAGSDRRELRRRLPVPRGVRVAAHEGQAGLRRARPRDHVVRPEPEPGPRGRRPHRVGARAQRRRAGVRLTAAHGLQGAGRGRGHRHLARRVDPRHRGHGVVLREERAEVARRPRTSARHPGAVRAGHHRLAVQPPAGPRQLVARAHSPGAQEEHLRRLQRRARAAVGAAAPASTSPPTRAASDWPAGPSPTSRCGS